MVTVAMQVHGSGMRTIEEGSLFGGISSSGECSVLRQCGSRFWGLERLVQLSDDGFAC